MKEILYFIDLFTEKRLSLSVSKKGITAALLTTEAASLRRLLVKAFRGAPAGYAADFGVTEDGRTLLVEVNDGFALGCYGADPVQYAKLLSARWCELIGIHDECDTFFEKTDWIREKQYKTKEEKIYRQMTENVWKTATSTNTVLSSGNSARTTPGLLKKIRKILRKRKTF